MRKLQVIFDSKSRNNFDLNQSDKFDSFCSLRSIDKIEENKS